MVQERLLQHGPHDARNPHCYFARSKVRRPDMYERVVAYVLAHGYPQKYGRSTYTCLDVRMNGGTWFLWPMTDRPEESEVLNLKPDSMRPDEEHMTEADESAAVAQLRPRDRPDPGAPPPHDTFLINGAKVVHDRRCQAARGRGPCRWIGGEE